MKTNRIATLSLFSLLAVGGCANSVVSPAMRSTLPTAELQPQSAPPGTGIELVALPVQLGQWVGPARLGDHRSAVALRVPDVDTPSTEWFVAPATEPKLVGTDTWPRFDYRTVPVLPFGSFWIEITNHTSQPMEIDPKHLALDLGDKHMVALSDGGTISGRWNLTLTLVPHHRIGRPRIGPQLRNVFLTLPLLEKKVELAAGATWKGYAVFDTGAYTADEYNALQQKAGGGKLTLGDGKSELANVAFKTEVKDLPAVCLTGTKKATFERCELTAP